MTIRDLKEKRARAVAAMRAITAAPAGDGGDLSPEQATEFDAHKAELEKLETRIARQTAIDDAERRMNGQRLAGGVVDDFGRACREFSLVRAIAAQVPDIAGSVDAGREREVSQELARRMGRPVEGFVVPLLAFVPERRMEQRVLTVAGDGGNLVQTTVLADQFIDALRPASVTTRLGARVIADLMGDIALPKMDALTPAAEWVAENSALTPGDHSFTQVTGAPKHLGLLTELSRKTLKQTSPQIEAVVRADFMAKLAAGVDLAVLKGSGAPQPSGITEATAVGVLSSSGAAPTWAQVVDAMAMVEAADVPQAALGWCMNAHTKATFRSTLKVAAQPIYLMGDENTMGGAPVGVTSQLAGDSESPSEDGEVIFGSWPEVITAFWGGVEILVNPFESTAYTKGNVMIRAFVDADVLVRHDQAFVHWTDILQAA